MRRTPAGAIPASVATPRLLHVAADRARRFQALKEEAKHEAMRELAVLRNLLRHAGERFGLGCAVFDLSPAEVARLADAGFCATAAKLAAERAERRALLLAVEVPSVLTAAIVESLGDRAAGIATAAAFTTGAMYGACVAGSREVTGRVRVLHSPEQMRELQPGEILVARCTDPCWLSAFAIAGGLITEIGGWLSHAAIQAREQDLATIVGVPGALAVLQTGDLVRLRRDGSIERMAERREPRRAVAVAAELRVGELRQPVLVRDLGPGGAGIEVLEASALPRERFELLLGDDVLEVAVAWRNCTRAGVKFGAVRQAPSAPLDRAKRPAAI